MQRIWIVGLAIAMAVAVAGCGASTDSQGEARDNQGGSSRTTVVYSPAVQGALPFLPVEVAQKQGYFDSEGITLEVKPTDPSAIPAAISSGQLDMSADVVYNVARYLAKGLEVRLVSGLNDNVDFALVKRPGVDITSPSSGPDGWKTTFRSLEGMKIGVPGGLAGPLALTMTALLDKVGLHSGDYSLVAVGGPKTLSALKAGQIDAAVSGGGFDLSIVEKGAARSVLSFGKDIPNIFGHQSNAALFMSAKALEQTPDLAVRVQKAIEQAVEFIDDPKNLQSVVSIAVAAGIPETAHLSQRIATYDYDSVLVLSKVQAALDWAHSAGIISSDVSAKQAVASNVATR